MNVASLELCKELYELSGWDNREQYHYIDGSPVPAYDFGYLLRKLPEGTTIRVNKRNPVKLGKNQGPYSALMYGYRGAVRADTPEDCAAKLAIELLKQGVLSKQPNATNGMEGEKNGHTS